MPLERKGGDCFFMDFLPGLRFHHLKQHQVPRTPCLYPFKGLDKNSDKQGSMSAKSTFSMPGER
eukprot:617453-Pelagomonas_calceolata.AAC.5